MTIKTFSFLLFTIAISSCKPDDSYNVNYGGDKLVINGILEGNLGVRVALSKSQSPAGIIPDAGFDVKNGRVWLYQNDTLVAEMTLNALGKFTINNFKPQVGKTYRLKAVAANLDTAESLPIVMPDVPTISSFTFKKDNRYVVSNNGNDRGAIFFSVNLKDINIEKNYYALDGYAQISKDTTESFFYQILSNLESCEFYGNIFTDKCFNNNSFTIDYISEHSNRGVFKIDLSGVDKNYYTYYLSQIQPKGLELGFVEPKLVVSNIVNGYGIFAAKNTRTFTLKLD